MANSGDKELEVALELFNTELEKLKLKEKELAAVKRAEKKKAEAVKALQEAEKNPNLSEEETAAVKEDWLKADADLKRILAGEEPLAEEETATEEEITSEAIDEPESNEELIHDEQPAPEDEEITSKATDEP